MNTAATVYQTTITGEEIAPIVSKLEEAVLGEHQDKVLVALLAMSIAIAYPNISPEQLQKAVGSLSHYMCILVDSEEAVTDPRMMN